MHVLFDSKAGRLLAILIGEIDDKTLGYTSLAALPTAATSGVGFRHLVRKDAHTVGLFGSAGQAANQLLALTCERPITHVKVYSRNPDNRRRFAETYSEKFGIEITPVDSRMRSCVVLTSFSAPPIPACRCLTANGWSRASTSPA